MHNTASCTIQHVPYCKRLTFQPAHRISLFDKSAFISLRIDLARFSSFTRIWTSFLSLVSAPVHQKPVTKTNIVFQSKIQICSPMSKFSESSQLRWPAITRYRWHNLFSAKITQSFLRNQQWSKFNSKCFLLGILFSVKQAISRDPQSSMGAPQLNLKWSRVWLLMLRNTHV